MTAPMCYRVSYCSLVYLSVSGGLLQASLALFIKLSMHVQEGTINMVAAAATGPQVPTGWVRVLQVVVGGEWTRGAGAILDMAGEGWGWAMRGGDMVVVVTGMILGSKLFVCSRSALLRSDIPQPNVNFLLSQLLYVQHIREAC